MLVVLKSGIPAVEIDHITQEIRSILNVSVEKSVGKHKVVLGLIGDTATVDPFHIQKVSP